jgi:ribokinase
VTKPIVVVGSINMDLVCTAPRIPAPGETIWGDEFQTFHGGKGANQAVAAARLGASVVMLGRVGSDDFAGQLRGGLEHAGVAAEHVLATAGPSGVALISVDRAGQNSIIVVPGANGQLTAEDLERCSDVVRTAAIVLAQLEVPMPTVDALCQMAHAAGVPVILDPAPAAAVSAQTLRCVTYLTPNETETLAMCGWRDTTLTDALAEQAADRLLDGGPAHVILKLGARGVLLATSEGVRRHFPALPVSVVDSTAAGDAFNGGLAVALTRGDALEEAVRFAIAVAGVSVTRNGAQTSMPTLAEVHTLRAQHPEEAAPVAQP